MARELSNLWYDWAFADMFKSLYLNQTDLSYVEVTITSPVISTIGRNLLAKTY